MTDTLADYPRRNSLNALRLGLAALVIVSHAWPLGGFGPDPRIGGATLGEIAVAGFFGLSGWLITHSRCTSSATAFAWRRFVRLYPGFLVALLVVAFGFAPLAALLGDGGYVPWDGVVHVVANAGLYITEWTVGQSLPASAYPAWNGSLWTLFSEALCYAAVGLLVGLAGRRATPAVVIACWLVLTVLAAVEVDGGRAVADFLRLAPFFFAGATLYVLRDRVPLDPLLASGAAVAAVVALHVEPVLAALPVAYLALWLGARLPLRRVAARHDLSYGLYVYAFPVQQLVALLGGTRFGVAAYVLLSVLATVPFAAASWFGVERPALRLRHLLDPRDAADRLPAPTARHGRR